MSAGADGLVARLATAVAACWLLTSCEKAETGPDQAATVFGVPLAVFPAATDVMGACELAPDEADIVRKMIADRLPDPTPICGFNPIERIRAVVIGGEQASGETVFAIRGIARRELSTCLGKLGNQPHDEGRLTSLVVDGKTHWIGWLADDVFVVGFGRDRAFVERHLGLEKPLDRSARVVQMLAPRTAQCVFASTSPALAPLLGPGFEGLTETRGGVAHSDGRVELSVALHFATAGQADLAAQAIPRVVREMGASVAPAAVMSVLADLTQVKRSGTDVSLRIAVDRAASLRLAEAMR